VPCSRHSAAYLSRGAPLRASPPMNSPAKVLVSVMMIGGSCHLRASLRAMLHEEPGFCMAGETETCAAALDLVLRCQPDIALVDVCLPDRSGFEVVKCIRQLAPGCVSVVLSNAPDPCVEDVALMLGAKAVWHKGNDLGQLRQTLNRLILASPNRRISNSPVRSPAL
jgi:DNA-binding NarL/FixJ family response regulator